jgi:hypothetical protein
MIEDAQKYTTTAANPAFFLFSFVVLFLIRWGVACVRRRRRRRRCIGLWKSGFLVGHLWRCIGAVAFLYGICVFVA